MRLKVQRALGIFISTALMLTSLSGLRLQSVAAQEQERAKNRVIIVSADQPNVWTLEQAHYLLAQMHRRNLDLKAKSLEELDANEITGLRFDVLRTLLEIGVKFDDANRVSNRLLARNQTSNAERRQTVLNDRAQLRKESLDLASDIAQLEEDKANAESQEEKDRLDT
jgi:hypothetical protein